MSESDVDRKLAQASANSPELAAMLAGRHDDPSARYRRLLAVVLGAAVVVGGLWFAASSFGGRNAPARPHEPAQEIDTSKLLAPIKVEEVNGDEQVAAFQGFAVSVETEPPEGLVSIGGLLRGEAPVLATVACKPGEKIEIRAELPGYRPLRRTTLCREDALVKLTLRLGK
jgi:hypothetical protein